MISPIVILVNATPMKILVMILKMTERNKSPYDKLFIPWPPASN